MAKINEQLKSQEEIEIPLSMPSSSKIEALLTTIEGNKRYNQYLVNLRSRASMVSSALVLGINPNTLSKWIKRGKEEQLEPDSLYGRFFLESVQAVSDAVVKAEIEVNSEDPKFYLTRGMGRAIMGDLYNLSSDDGSVNYNLDGTVSPNTEDSKNVRSSEINPLTGEEKVDKISEHLNIQALIEFRKNGIDLNEVVDQMLKTHGVNNLEDKSDEDQD